MEDWASEIEALRAAIRDLDARIASMEQRAATDDERDHLRQIHYLLTSAKGHVGAIRVAREAHERRSD